MLTPSAIPCVLAVDDDPFMRAILEDNLNAGGLQALLAVDGEAAWQELERHAGRVECMVIDRMMPNLDGMGLLARVKADRRFEHLPVIFVTAAGAPEEISEGIAAGAYYYLVKPFDSQLLTTLVKSAVEDFRNIRGRRLVENELEIGFRSLSHARFNIRTVEDARSLAILLSQLYPVPQRVNLGIVELLINAVEHGNLGIDYADKTRLVLETRWDEEIEYRLTLPENAEKYVDVEYEREPELIRLTIRDQGKGFDWRGYMSIEAERALDPHGRGIAMSRMISFDHIEYLGQGNIVQAVVEI